MVLYILVIIIIITITIISHLNVYFSYLHANQWQDMIKPLSFSLSLYNMYTVSHRSEYTPHIFVNIWLYMFMWQHWRNDPLGCKGCTNFCEILCVYIYIYIYSNCLIFTDPDYNRVLKRQRKTDRKQKKMNCNFSQEDKCLAVCGHKTFTIQQFCAGCLIIYVKFQPLKF